MEQIGRGRNQGKVRTEHTANSSPVPTVHGRLPPKFNFGRLKTYCSWENPTVGKNTLVVIMVDNKGNKALDKIKWKVPNFNGESDPNLFLNWERHVENLFMVRNYSDNVKAK
ncbi:hypothetical protein M9H77_12411 [Catharanthus roseus]|uniref:Uncharacterized protein n=1 Tax=Catharanthus roseus TaxID=4058 RepID=A0ACC0BHF0_CATRO|nr:hypothetical protein M9H77_12411 [Catharanthus roseus]